MIVRVGRKGRKTLPPPRPTDEEAREMTRLLYRILTNDIERGARERWKWPARMFASDPPGKISVRVGGPAWQWIMSQKNPPGTVIPVPSPPSFWSRLWEHFNTNTEKNG